MTAGVALAAALAVSKSGERVSGVTAKLAGSVNTVEGAISGNKGPAFEGPAPADQSVGQYDALAPVVARGFVDPEGDRLSYSLAITGQLRAQDFTVQRHPDGVVVDGTAAGSGTLAVVARDPIGRTAVAGPISVTATPNEPPRIGSIPPAVTITEGGQLSVIYSAVTDPEGDEMTPFATGVSGASASLDSGVVTVISGPLSPGVHHLNLRVEDEHGAETAAPGVEVTVVPRTCDSLLDADPGALSGVHTIDPDGEGGAAPIQAECDMSSDGGGWTLIANYLHRGFTMPDALSLTDRLPLMGSSTLGSDESGSGLTWGHAAPALLAAIPGSEMRFYCRTSGHGRTVHFKTTAPDLLQYARSGNGFVDTASLRSTSTTLTGHSGYLPAAVDAYYADRGDRALVDFPFWNGGDYHWGIDARNFYVTGEPAGDLERWECDDYPAGPEHHTLHRIWIR